MTPEARLRARALAHEFCTREGLPNVCEGDVHYGPCYRLTAALTPYLEALERIAEYETDWTQGPAANVAALQAIAEAALLGQPRDAATGEFVPSSTVEGITTLGTNSAPPARPPLEPPFHTFEAFGDGERVRMSIDGKPVEPPCCEGLSAECVKAGKCCRPPEVPTCASWCGTLWSSHPSNHGGSVNYKRGATADDACYCTEACRDLGHPRSPVPREGE